MTSSPSKSRAGAGRGAAPARAFTLLELLVTLGVMGVLTGLILGGVVRARAAAARLACSNNLAQISLALQAYHGQVGKFPPGLMSDTPSSKMPYAGWGVYLLPHLEMSPVWDAATAAFAQDRNFQSIPPHTGLSTPIPIYSCPSDGRTRETQFIGPTRLPRALTSYLGVSGTNAFRLDGVLYLDSAVRVADVTDGTSNTLAVGERPPSAEMILGWWYAGWGQTQDGDAEMVLGVRTKNRWRYGQGCPEGPYGFSPGRIDNRCDVFHFWSLHSGGANFAFADGSVRFLRYSAEPVMAALATRAGGEAAGISD